MLVKFVINGLRPRFLKREIKSDPGVGCVISYSWERSEWEWDQAGLDDVLLLLFTFRSSQTALQRWSSLRLAEAWVGASEPEACCPSGLSSARIRPRLSEDRFQNIQSPPFYLLGWPCLWQKAGEKIILAWLSLTFQEEQHCYSVGHKHKSWSYFMKYDFLNQRLKV